MGDGTICKACMEEIEDREPWHYRYKRKAGLFEPVHDKYVPPEPE